MDKGILGVEGNKQGWGGAEMEERIPGRTDQKLSVYESAIRKHVTLNANFKK